MPSVVERNLFCVSLPMARFLHVGRRQDRLADLEAQLRLVGIQAQQVRRGPMNDTSDITISSRIGSIGGFGDLREQLFEVGVQHLARFDNTASGVSLPIEPIASWPVTAIASSGT